MIFMKKLIFFIVLHCSVSAFATSIVITPQTGSNSAQDIAIIGKLTFENNQLQLLDKEGNILASEPVDNIRKITFSESVPTALEDTKNTSIFIYPNPTHDILIIKGIENQSLRVYDLQGKMILHEHGTEVHVSHLATGTYLLQIGTQVVRFIKQ